MMFNIFSKYFSFDCFYFQGAGKMFSVGLGIQVALKLILNIKKVFTSPRSLKTTLFRKDNLNLAIFLGGFVGIFRVSVRKN